MICYTIDSIVAVDRSLLGANEKFIVQNNQDSLYVFVAFTLPHGLRAPGACFQPAPVSCRSGVKTFSLLCLLVARTRGFFQKKTNRFYCNAQKHGTKYFMRRQQPRSGFKKFTISYKTVRFVTALTGIRHCVNSKHLKPVHTLFRLFIFYILLLSSDLRLGLSSSLSLSGFPIKILEAFRIRPSCGKF